MVPDRGRIFLLFGTPILCENEEEHAQYCTPSPAFVGCWNLIGADLPQFQFLWLFGNFTFMFLYTFLGRCVEFFIGMGLALIILKTDEADRKWPIFTF